MSHVLPNISRGRFFEPIFTSKKFDLYTSIYGRLWNTQDTVCILEQHVIVDWMIHKVNLATQKNIENSKIIELNHTCSWGNQLIPKVLYRVIRE